LKKEGRQTQNNKSASEIKWNPEGTFSYETIGRGNAECSTISLESERVKGLTGAWTVL